MAAAHDKEPMSQRVIKPKRERRPRTVADGPSEHQEQAALIRWWAHAHNLYQLPIFALFAVPNGGARDPITGSRLKAEGTRPGVYDLILAKPAGAYHGLYMEMKVCDNKPSADQVLFGEYLASVGYSASVHWSSGSAIKAVQDYLA